ncbi:MBL fold metallo-hydrolase [Candidatus Bathyarchaeota archaeon]|nr:MBL fold metallo-hydrolase [Candidatus Bathyarchaeota archaeon]
MFFKQIKSKGDNFSYVIADENNGEAVIVDPSFNADTIINLIEECGCTVKYVINTHFHWDHVAGNDEIIEKFNAKLVAHQLSKVNKTISVVDGDILKIGNVTIRIIHTPGHTQDSICLLIDDMLLTGDTLFVGGCGRTDLPGGSSSEMYNSLFNKLMKLNDEIKVYPGHDYGPSPHSTIGHEKKTNYTLKKRTLKQFIEFVKEP